MYDDIVSLKMYSKIMISWCGGCSSGAITFNKIKYVFLSYFVSCFVFLQFSKPLITLLWLLSLCSNKDGIKVLQVIATCAKGNSLYVLINSCVEQRKETGDQETFRK